jgi:hypothetical protein
MHIQANLASQSIFAGGWKNEEMNLVELGHGRQPSNEAIFKYPD